MHDAFPTKTLSDKEPDDLPDADGRQLPWYRLLTSYHWFVLLVAALGWLFDCMDQQLFILARVPALKALLPAAASENFFAGLVTAIFIVGWATGGLIFGVLGDRIGRARVMMWTILIYSVCTGLTAFSVSVWDFALYRFLTGMGVGGEFAVGVALVAEVMPSRAGRSPWPCSRRSRPSATSPPPWSVWASVTWPRPAGSPASPPRGNSCS